MAREASKTVLCQIMFAIQTNYGRMATVSERVTFEAATVIYDFHSASVAVRRHVWLRVAIRV